MRIVTVAFNPGEELFTLLDSLELQDVTATDAENWEIVIVNNGEDNSVLQTAALRSNVQVLEAGKNLGYGQAVNLGAEGYSGEWLLVVNPDVEFSASAVRELRAAAQRHPQAGVLGPRIYDAAGEIYPSARNFPRLGSGIGHALLSPFWSQNPFTRKYQNLLTSEQDMGVDWLSGACLLIRMEAFRACGGFDRRYFMFFEDTQLGEDMRQQGWESIYVPAARVIHQQGKSWKERPQAMIVAHHRSAYLYLADIYSQPLQAPLRKILQLGLALRCAWLKRQSER